MWAMTYCLLAVGCYCSHDVHYCYSQYSDFYEDVKKAPRVHARRHEGQQQVQHPEAEGAVALDASFEDGRLEQTTVD